MSVAQSGAVALLAVCGLWLLVGDDWRGALAALALQYGAAALLVAEMWPPRMALVKVLAGWGAVLILLSAARASGVKPFPGAASAWSAALFRLTAGGLVLLAAVSLLPLFLEAVPGIQPSALLAAMWLVGSGLLRLGFTSHPLRVATAWLSVMTGFEIAYAAVERALLVAALLAALHIVLALVGAYLLNVFEESAG